MCSDDRISAAGRALVAALLAVCASAAIPAVAPFPHPTAALPPPPYPRFAGQTFEPSAAAFDPATGRVLVLSDNDTTLYRYELGATGLVLPPGERHFPLRLPEGMQAAKLEGLTRLPSGAFLAVTAFDRPDPSFRRLLRFSYAPAVPGDAVPLRCRRRAPSPPRSAPRRDCPGSRSKASRSIARGRGPASASGASATATRRRETWCSWCAAPSPTTGSALRRP